MNTDTPIIKLNNDFSEYTYFTLENKLNVFIIHDTDIINSAVAMRVNVGYMEDEIPGQAHLLEHMLFVGNKNSSDTNYFSKYIESNNGYTNAYTSDDHTCYYYEIANNKLIESLEKIVDFFTVPTLNNESIDKEKEAVNAEHSKNKYNDSRLNYEIFKKAMNQESPYAKFSTGCNKTLNIENIGEKIREFYNTHYSANIMTLAIITNEPLDYVKNKIILSKFNLIENKNLKHYDKNDVEFIKEPKFVLMNSISDLDELRLYWNVNSYYDNYNWSPLSYISHLLGNEEDNTIYSILMDLGYIQSISTGMSYSNRKFGVFSINIKLTELGFNNYEQVIDIIYKYIELLLDPNNKKVLDELYNDYYKVFNFNANNFVKYSPIDRIFNIIGTFNDINIIPSMILIKDTQYRELFKDIYDNFMTTVKQLNKDNCVVVLKSQKANNFCQPCNLELTYYEHIKYNLIDQTMKIDNEIINFIFKLPNKNDYISVTREFSYSGEEKIILPGCNLFLYSVDKYKNPNVYIKMSIKFDSTVNNLMDRLMLRIYLNALNKSINRELYKMSCAGYDINLSYDYENTSEYEINIYGNHGKIYDVFSYILNNIGLHVDQKYIDLQIEKTKKYCINYKYTEQYKLIKSQLLYEISNNYMDNQYVMENIGDNYKIDYNILNKLLFTNNKIKMVICGNTQDRLNKYAEIITNKFNCSDELMDMTKYDFTTNGFSHIMKPMNDKDTNCTVGIYYYICTNDDLHDKMSDSNYLKKYAISRILNTQMNKDFFTELRTQECFGYIVSASMCILSHNEYNKTNNLCQRFLVQSPNKNTKEIIFRIKQFIDDFNISPDIQGLKLQIIDELKKDHESLMDLASYYYNKTYGNKYIDINKLLIEVYDKITYEDIIEVYNNYIKNGNMLIVGFDSNI